VFNKDKYFDMVRQRPFGGSLTGSQVSGQEAILDAWTAFYSDDDLRWLAYCLATTAHETAMQMMPIEEFGKGEGMAYGSEDPPGSGNVYYGRGFVQLTWRDNYRRADDELDLTSQRSCELHPDNALKLDIAARVLFRGCMEGWFRSDSAGPYTLARFFDEDTNDPYGARQIINGDKSHSSSVPGKTIGQLISDYHYDFVEALEEALTPATAAPTVYEVVLRLRVTAVELTNVEILEAEFQ
jgi:hypothetical protein